MVKTDIHRDLVTNEANLCSEIPVGPVGECVLGKPDLVKLSHNHLTQIQTELWKRGGGSEGKIINSFYSGATFDHLLSKVEVNDFADRMIWFYGDAKKASDQIDRFKAERNGARVDTEIPYEMPPKKSTMEVYDEISLDWKTQIYNHVVRAFGGKPSSYLQGINKDTLLPQIAVEEFAKIVIDENDGDPRLAADVLKAAMTEHVTLMSAMAMNQAMKEKGLMGQITKVTDKMIEQVNTKGEQNEALAALLEKGPEGHAPNVDEFLANVSPVTKAAAKHLDTGPLVTRKVKRKKSKPKSQHIPNMQNKSVKRALGASILHMLGSVQRDTQDAQKRALLKELPAADVLEMATGKKLPDYQANLINAAQAKADPEAPIVKRMSTTESNVDTYERLLDEALAKYITPDLVPGMSEEKLNKFIAGVKETFMQRKEKIPTAEDITITDGSMVSVDFRLPGEEGLATTIPVAEVSVTFVGGAQGLETQDGSDKRDLRVESEDDKWFIHYERFTEDAADGLQTSIAYIEDRIGGDQFYNGLEETIVQNLQIKLPVWRQTFDNEEIHQLISKLVAGYTAGYVQAFIDKEHKDRQTTAQMQAADLG